MNSEILSPIYGLVEEGAMIAIVSDSIKSDSISIRKKKSAIVTITKVKKSKIMNNK